MICVIWTARLTVAAYLTAVALMLSRSSRRLALSVWSAGFAVFCLHVLAAFQFVHHWSHAAARQHTAEQTKELLGWDWGGGIWFNYLFLALWGVNVLLGWMTFRTRPQTVKWFTYLSSGTHIYLGFIVINATIVFGPRVWQPVMVLAALVLIGLAYRARRMTDISPDQNP